MSYQGQMKIVTWNCNGAFRRKYQRISAMDADIYVIQECEKPLASMPDYQDWAGAHLWAGQIASKGIGVFVKNGLSLAALDWPNYGLQQFLPARIDGRMNLLAVWTKNDPVNRMGYIGQFWQYLQHHSSLWNDETIICGDFNSNAIWDKRGRHWNHSECVNLLAELGLNSCYHSSTREEHGNETQPTLYMQRNLAKPYHVDYIFARQATVPSQSNVTLVGRAEDWLDVSDHMPIATDI